MTKKPRVLLLSPYDAMSHQYWRDRLEADLSKYYALEVVTLPPRFFSWRFRGNSLTLSQDNRVAQRFDLIIATSITDLAALKGMQPALQNVPTVLYFHENQFAYPDRQKERQTERQITSIYSAITADKLLFNSEFNLTTFMDGADELLSKMPDGVPPGAVAALREKSEVVSVAIDRVAIHRVAIDGVAIDGVAIDGVAIDGVAIDPVDSATVNSAGVGKEQPHSNNSKREAQPNLSPLSIVWNHRWEHDKGLDELLELTKALQLALPVFTLHLIGQQFRQVPKVVEQITAQLGDLVGRVGFIKDRSEYLALLAETDVVLSTARHEFQGIAVLEAVGSGCLPVVPDSLAYREFIAPECRYASVTEAVELICHHADVRAARRAQRRNGSASSELIPTSVTPEYVSTQWHQLIKQLLN